MNCGKEMTLQELLAEPMVLALMERDGVLMADARALYESVASRQEDRMMRSASAAGIPGGESQRRPSPGHISG